MKKIFEKLYDFNQIIIDKIHSKTKPLIENFKKWYANSKLQKGIKFLKIDRFVCYLIDIHFFRRILLLVVIPLIIYLYSH